MEEIFSSVKKSKPTESRTEILNKLIEIVKLCQTKYGDKKELATEDDDLIADLCETWEKVFYHGLHIPNGSFFRNIQKKECVEDPFWNFSRTHLTKHELERFLSLHHVWTNHGKVKALIRAALNEHSLERYILMWLDDCSYRNVYEPWALMQDPEAINLLPSMAAGLASILFAIVIDKPEINVDTTDVRQKEPIIQPPKPVRPSKKSVAINREIVSFDDSSSSRAGLINDNRECEYVEEEIAAEVYDTLKPIPVERIYPKSTILATESVDISEVVEVTKPNFIPNSVEDTETSSTRSRYSTSEGSSSSLSNDSCKLKDKVNELTNKCAFLEAKVADLILENQRLKQVSTTSDFKGLAFSISIPRVVLHRKGVKRYYAYEIHVNWADNVGEWITLKRYSQFYELHHQLMKDNPIVNVLDFPPKKKLGNMDISFVEDRRQRLQAYLRHLVKVLPNVSPCSTLVELWNQFPFLK